ncbi:MAG: MMPL family transporter, partial [Actinobacteria bacterium]|nr:MMPL family transporter [Actinomycetota bacterium]
MGSALAALGSFCARRKFTVLIGWAILIAVMLGMIGAFGAQVNNNFSLPGTGSQSATDLLESDFPPQQNGTSPILFHVETGSMNDSSNKAAVEASLQNILAVPNVFSATDPYAQPLAGLVSEDGSTALIPVLMDISSGSLTIETAEPVLAATQPAIDAGITTAAGGPIGSALSEPDTGPSEAIGMIAAAIILAFVFGTLIAIGLPLVTAVFGLVVGIAAVGLLGHIVAIPSTGTTLATMIGLGVGIDYSLFLISKHLENLRAGLSVHESVRLTVATSGNAVVFAGTTVIIALLALGVANIPLVTALGYATAVAVATAVLAAITLLPAILGLSGMKILALRIPGLGKGMSKDPANTVWGKWSRLVT